MNKEEILECIRQLASQKLISKNELIEAFDSGSGDQKGSFNALTKNLGISEVLAYVGAGIVALGIGILLTTNWSSLNSVARISSTLGAAIAAHFIGIILSRDAKMKTISPAFFLISAIVYPVGLFVVLDTAQIDASSYGAQSFIAALLAVLFLANFSLMKNLLFVFFSVIYTTWLYFAFTSLLGDDLDLGFDFLNYRILLAGISYLALGYSFSLKERFSSLKGFFYAFGILGVLGSTLALGGWAPNQNIFWEVVFPGLVFAAFNLSVYLNEKSFLTFGALFLMIYIIKITSEYFTSSLGWPLSLVIAGLSLIAVGGFSYSYSKRHFK